MANTITVDTKTINLILKRLKELTIEVKELREQIFKSEPSYGSPAWWEKEEVGADEDFKKGRYTTIHNKKELDDFFKSL